MNEKTLNNPSHSRKQDPSKSRSKESKSAIVPPPNFFLEVLHKIQMSVYPIVIDKEFVKWIKKAVS